MVPVITVVTSVLVMKEPVIDENLALGMIANTAAIMGITLGKQRPEVMGADVYDTTGNSRLGIIEFPVPILKGDKIKQKTTYRVQINDDELIRRSVEGLKNMEVIPKARIVTKTADIHIDIHHSH